MSIIASLNRAYDRLASRNEVASYGFSSEKIGFIISLNPDGTLACPPIDWREMSGKKLVPRRMNVPQPPKKSANIAPNFLWGNTAYALGITAGEGRRLEKEHAAFVDFHKASIGNTKDEGLIAFWKFLQKWNSTDFETLDWSDEIKKNIKDQNIAFILESDRQDNIFIHGRAEAREIWSRLCDSQEKTEAICLVTGKMAPIARLHASIKGVWGSQSSGASIVSFNADAYESYGHEQGGNAPISEAAVFAYTTVLNKFLEKDSGHRIQIGDASTVFWADATEAENANDTQTLFASFFGGVDESVEVQSKVKPILEKIRQGQPVQSFAPDLERVKFYVLGLAPNAARLSVRFWVDNDFGSIARNYQKFLSDMCIDPPDRDENIALWKYLEELAVLRKRENIPPNLAGEWMRSILTGTHYPFTLLSAVLMRIRADRNIDAKRVSILKAVLTRNLKSKEAPVAFDPENKNKGYLLGRLFAVYERIQSEALGRNVNSTIKDKFYGSASAQPRKIFHMLESGSANHLSKLGKQKAGYRVLLEKAVGDIMNQMSPAEDPFPSTLSNADQALFGLGYYHQRSEFFKSKPATTEQNQGA